MIKWIVLLVGVAALGGSSAAFAAPPDLHAGFAAVDITPEIKPDKPVWLAGYGHGRKATGVHDPLYARAVVLRCGEKQQAQKLALVSVDLVGLQYPQVKEIRDRLKDYQYVLVSSTHNHEGPDVIGIWGKTVAQRGVDDNYLRLVVEKTVQAIRKAEKSLAAVSAQYGTAADEKLLGDSRLPIVYDDVLRVVKLTHRQTKQTAGILVQWNCHPESLGSRNTLIAADFPYVVIAALQKKHGCPIAYFTGTVGGLMAPPDKLQIRPGKTLLDGNFEYAEAYGKMVADLANKAINSATAVRLTPFRVAARPIYIPVQNPYYRTGHLLGVLRREAFVSTGDVEKKGPPRTRQNADQTMTVETEVAYLRLGELHIACIPGEIYPELVYGRIEDPPVKGVDFPDAPKEPSVVDLLPGKKWLLLGLANDEVGYILPKRQWDQKPPFAYGRKKSQYGEINSCGPDVAPILMRALSHRVREIRDAP